MKLYIVAANDEVIRRWVRFAGIKPSVIVNSEEMVVASKSEKNVGLLHLGSTSQEYVDNVCEQYPDILWIAFSDIPKDQEGLRLLERGFRGYINTYVTASLFDQLVNVVAKNDIWAGPTIVQTLLKRHIGSVHTLNAEADFSEKVEYDLTDREQQVLDRLVGGASNKEIAKMLGITERTVKAHVTSILRKTETTDRVSLIIKLTNQVA
jgi:DNA-binding NarL/FixJ family response regulator